MGEFGAGRDDVPRRSNGLPKDHAGEESFTIEPADAALVADINLRTYGWADIAIFGTNEQALRDVHDEAQAHLASVPRAVVPLIHADGTARSNTPA